MKATLYRAENSVKILHVQEQENCAVSSLFEAEPPLTNPITKVITISLDKDSKPKNLIDCLKPDIIIFDEDNNEELKGFIVCNISINNITNPITLCRAKEHIFLMRKIENEIRLAEAYQLFLLISQWNDIKQRIL